MTRPHPKLGGVFVATFTAFDRCGSIDATRTARHAQRLLDQQCDGIALLGTTGEANSLSLAERNRLLEAVVEAGIPPQRLLPGTGVCSVPETIDLSHHARALGIDTILLLPPFYYPDPSEAGLVAHYSRILDSVAADGLGVLLYHIPQMTGVAITPALIAALRRRFPGVIAGVKDSSGDLGRIEAMIAAFPDLAIFAGADHLLAPVLRAGGGGTISATSNLIAPLLVDLRKRIMAGEDQAQTADLERRIAAARDLFRRWPQIPALKAAHAAISGDPGWHHVRPPLLPLDPNEHDALIAAMAGAGLTAE